MFGIRNKLLVVSLAVVIALPLLLAGSAEARGGHGGGGGGHGGFHGGGFHGGHFHHGGGSHVFIGGFFGFPFYPYGYYPYYSYPYPYYSYAEPPVYVEPQEDSSWYYCQDPQGYYPYVTNCPGGWTSVVSTPLHLEEQGTVK